jgi:NADH-quinone oxidoreductase subunit E
MLSQKERHRLQEELAKEEHPRERVIDVLYAAQKSYGYLSDEALHEVAELMSMTPLEVEEIATFYDFIYREPVGRYVIHVCDGTVCWNLGHESVMNYLSQKLKISVGETTPDGLFTLLPVTCIGYCEYAPAMLVNGRLHGPLTPETIDDILAELRAQQPPVREDR